MQHQSERLSEHLLDVSEKIKKLESSTFSRKRWPRRGAVSWILFLALLLIVGWLMRFSFDVIHQQRSYAFEREAEVLSQRVVERLSHYKYLALSVHGFLLGSELVERSEWDDFLAAQRLESRFPHLASVAFAFNADAPRSTHYRHEITLLEEMELRSWRYENGQRRSHNQQWAGFPVVYVTPFDDYFIGLDLSSLPGFTRELLKPRKDPALHTGVDLMLQRATTLSYSLPFYHREVPDVVEGIVLVSFFADKVFAEFRRTRLDLGWELYQGRQDDPDWIVYDTDTIPFVEYEQEPDFARDIQLSYGGQQFLLKVHAPKGWTVPVINERMPYYVGGIGLIFSLLVLAISWALEHTRERALTIAERMTEELRYVNYLLSEMATTDSLCQLANRRRFLERLEQEVNRYQRYQDHFVLILFDLDHFKQINDTHGHPMGDLVLQNIGRILKESTRVTDLPARIGGEEFGVILPNTDLKTGQLVAEQIRTQIAQLQHQLAGTSVQCSASFGVVGTESMTTISSEGMMQQADKALYAAKAAGRNCVHTAAL